MLLVYTNVIQMPTVKTQMAAIFVPVKKAMLEMASSVKVCVCVCICILARSLCKCVAMHMCKLHANTCRYIARLSGIYRTMNMSQVITLFVLYIAQCHTYIQLVLGPVDSCLKWRVSGMHLSALSPTQSRWHEGGLQKCIHML